LIQHIPDEINNPIEHEQKKPRNQAGHSVIIKENTKLYNIISTKEIMVNSAHHQAVKKPGNGLIVNAISSDGVIEGIEDPKKNFCIGVQWHPEFFIQGSDNKLLKAFIEAC
jgi:putative glutamine amidotransferase